MAKTLTTIVGLILVLLGLFGFTSNSLVGSNALFVSDATHNWIHLILGAILLYAVFWGANRCDSWVKWSGALLFLLGLVGLFTVSSSGGMLLGIAATNGASNWLNLIAGALIFFGGKKDRMNGGMPPMQSMPSSGSPGQMG